MENILSKYQEYFLGSDDFKKNQPNWSEIEENIDNEGVCHIYYQECYQVHVNPTGLLEACSGSW